MDTAGERFTTLITAGQLATHLDDPDWVIADCRFELANPESGEFDYRSSHIPGAVYAHLDRDLSSKEPVTDSGRHPLPSPAAMVELFGRVGIDENVQVVAYDETNGHYAARLWWMLRYMGHEATAVLEGGWCNWEEAGYPVNNGVEEREPRPFSGAPREDRLVLLDDVPRAGLLIDSRNGERYRGEVEPLDRVPGHIPGADNYPYGQNWDGDKAWRPANEINNAFAELLNETPPEEAVLYCGSGVSACVNVLAMVHAGLPEPRLYVGSWSEWSSAPQRPVATGDDS